MVDIDQIRERLRVANLPGFLDRNVGDLILEVERLREYVEADCRCGCCPSVDVCVSWCTLKTDDNEAWKRMQAARKALWGDNAKGQ